MAIIHTGLDDAFSITISIDDNTFENEFIKNVENALPHYMFDHYRYYPSLSKNSWEIFFLLKLRDILKSPEWEIFYDVYDNSLNLIGCKISKWDEDHFGYKFASINLLVSSNGFSSLNRVEPMLVSCIRVLREKNVKFVSTRINGDLISIIHIFENMGFRCFESNTWPVASCEKIPGINDSNIRCMCANDIDRVLYIAENFPYRGGHFYTDEKFDKQKVDAMFKKWVNTAWNNNQTIAVIEHEGEVAGCFVFNIDKDLSESLGYKYARMTFLALDSKFRGIGLGMKLFQGTMSLAKEMGAEYIDSGYSVNNHVSARLHINNLFYPVYTETTFHYWT